jgi:regulator of sigma E protease
MPTWLVFLLVLSVLVLVHELGHYFAAVILGIKVEEFAFGLPFTKPIFKVSFRGTQYAVYPLLFGGFVRLLGEEGPPPADKPSEVLAIEGKDFWSRGKKQRVAVVLAGVVMNIILALVVFGVLYSVAGVPRTSQSKVTVVEVAPGSPAANEGLRVEDRVVAVEGKPVYSVQQFGQLMKSWAGLKVTLAVERGPVTPLFEGIAEGKIENQEIVIVPRKNPPEGEGALGVTISDYPYLSMHKCSVLSAQCSFDIVRQGVKSTGIWVGRVLEGLRSIGKSLVAGKAPEGVSGPVGIYQLTGLVAAEGWLPLLELVAVLSVNLAVFNILPVPALDGGRILFIWLEYILKRRLPAELEQKVNSWGMIFLLTLMALVSLQDVWRLGVVSKLLGQ